MTPYAILCFDAPGKRSLRADTRPRHLDHLAELGDRVIRAGPLLDDAGVPTGSLILATFDDRAAAEAFAAADPYAQAGLFAEVRVSAWRQVLP